MAPPKMEDRFESWEALVDDTTNKLLLGNLISQNEKKEFKEWFMQKQHVGWRFDRFALSRIFSIYKRLKKQSDSVIVIVGPEGSGKSTFAIQLLAMLDPTFNPSRVCLEPVDFLRNLRTMEPGQGISIDEGALAMFSREAMTTLTRNFVKTFMVVRRKSLGCIINIPSYKDLDRYIREHRMSLLIRIKERGKYRAYFGKAIKKVNEDIKKGKPLEQIQIPGDSFWDGYFSKEFPKTINVEEYLKKKDEHIDKFLKEVEKESQTKIEKRFVSRSEISKILGLNKMTIYNLEKAGKIKGVNLGRKYIYPIDQLEKIYKTGEKQLFS